MFNSLNKKYPFNDDLKINLTSIGGISVGVFFFLLFFQPLNPQNPDFNNKLLILAGFSLITFILFALLRIVIPSFFFNPEKWNLKKELILNLLFLIFNSVAFVFFARYVGKIEITFFKTILIVLISLSSMFISIAVNQYRFLKLQLQLLTDSVIEEDPETEPSIEIEFESENKSDYFSVLPQQIILIKSANNYIEIIYKNNDKTSKRLIRNTLKNTEKLLSKCPFLIRCHRSYIVNKNFIQKVMKGSDGLKVILFDYPHEIFVSRHYVLTVKEALKAN